MIPAFSHIFSRVLIVSALTALQIFTGFAQVPYAGDTKLTDDKHWDNRFDSANSLNGPVYAIFVQDTSVYAGGSFTMAGSQSANSIARWDGHQWHALGDGMGGGSGPLAPVVYAITSDNAGHIYAGGNFISAGSTGASNIAMWDGNGWAALDSGLNDEVRALAAGPGGELYAGGRFTMSGMTPMHHLAQWNGSAWSMPGGGITGTVVNSIAVKGTSIAVAGYFSQAGATAAENIAIWDGATWVPAGSGTDSTVNSLIYKGNDLYAGGCFLNAGSVPVNYFGKYLSGSWSAIGAGCDYAPSAISYNQTDVFVTSTVSGAGANHIAKYDCCWDPLGSGLDTTAYAICVNGNDVWTGGPFMVAGGKPSVHFAHWNVTKDFTAGIEDIRPAKGVLSVFPNPVREKLNISASDMKQGLCQIDIYSPAGTLIRTKTVENRHSGSIWSIDVRDLRTGIYFVRLWSDTYSATGRFMVE